jgi:hypothetical protein
LKIKRITARIVYRHKKSAEDIEFQVQVINAKHAMEIARKLRPRYCKLLKVELFSEQNLFAR